MFPQIELYYPDTRIILIIGLAVMTLAIVTALFALVRGTLALRAVTAIGLQQAHHLVRRVDVRTSPSPFSIAVLDYGILPLINNAIDKGRYDYDG